MNIEIGTRYLALRISDKGGNLSRALDAYGTGPGKGYASPILGSHVALQADRKRNPIGVLTRLLGEQ